MKIMHAAFPESTEKAHVNGRSCPLSDGTVPIDGSGPCCRIDLTDLVTKLDFLGEKSLVFQLTDSASNEWAGINADQILEVAIRLEAQHFEFYIDPEHPTGGGPRPLDAEPFDAEFVERLYEAARWFRRVHWAGHCVELVPVLK